MFSCAHALGRQLPAVWVGGRGGGVCDRRRIGDSFADRRRLAGLLPRWLAGALFVPTFALALGVWSGSSRLFEASVHAVVVRGPMNHAPGLDFTGIAPHAPGTPVYVVATIALLMAAYVGRRSKLGYA